jgi:hypothetical protein
LLKAHFSDLSRLSDWFGLDDLRATLSELLPLQEPEDAEALAQIAALEEWAPRRHCGFSNEVHASGKGSRGTGVCFSLSFCALAGALG